MNDLLARAIAAHGGLERWNTFNKLTATVLAGGGLRPMKGLEGDTTPRERAVTLHEETTCISPFGQPDWRMAFTPDRVAIETTKGAVVSERSNPRAAFAGHVLETVWDPLHNAYFGDDFLLRRHDYHLDVAGRVPVAQYVYDMVEADGFRCPTRRRMYVRGPGLKPIRDLLLISLDLSNFRLTT